MAEGRVRQLRISEEGLTGLLRTGKTIQQGIPDGAELVGAGYDHETGVFYLTFEHGSFEPVAEGERIPPLGIEVSWDSEVADDG